MINKKTEYSNRLGHFLSVLVGIPLMLAGVLLYIVILSRLIHVIPWFVQLWIAETIFVPIILSWCFLYIRLYPYPSLEKYFSSRPKRMLGAFIVVYLFCLGLVFFAFLFGTFAPFLPQDFRDVFLPILSSLTIFTVIGTTKIRYVLWNYFKRFF